jgi:methylase of polypeptide subunit release factors
MHLAKLLVDGKLHESHTENFREDGKTNCKEKNNPLPTLRILDGCSGTGCISLLLHHQLSRHFRNLRIIGLDISPLAVALSNENLKRNLKKGILQESAIGKVDHQRDGRSDSAILAQRVPQVQFMAHDIFHGLPKWIGSLDIIISNPPYISNAKFNTETSRSVRNWEPKLALVPQSRSFLRPRHGPSISEPEDVFYDQLLSIHRGSFCKFLVMEVGDEEQAIRVVSLALRRRDIKVRNHIEIWRDWPDDAVDMGEMEIEGRRIFVKGSGKVRAVVLFRTRKIKTPQTKLPPLEMVEELAEEAQQKPQVPLVLGRSAAEKSDRVGTFGPDADR